MSDSPPKSTDEGMPVLAPGPASAPASAPAYTPADLNPAPPAATIVAPHVHYALNLDTSVGGPSHSPYPAGYGITRSDSDLQARHSGLSPMTPGMRRRNTRAATFRTVEDFEDLDVRPGWHPGAEPGFDPSLPDGGHSMMPTLHAPSQITVVDFSQHHVDLQRLDNETIVPFLQTPPPSWMKCRWINVNGLSWDVIQALGQYKKLHRLAIEDLMNTRNRTKSDWYGLRCCFVPMLR